MYILSYKKSFMLMMINLLIIGLKLYKEQFLCQLPPTEVGGMNWDSLV